MVVVLDAGSWCKRLEGQPRGLAELGSGKGTATSSFLPASQDKGVCAET